MIDALIQLVLFCIETIIIVVAILVILAGIGGLFSKGKDNNDSKIKLKKLNKSLAKMTEHMQKVLLSKKAYKQYCKTSKKQKSDKAADRQRVFVLNFQGDVRASQTENLRKEITAVLSVAKPTDEVLLKLESPGGVVPGYGLAASQLMRLKDHQIPLTICVDKVAASGGYMMACVADKILAAPFAIIGSIGVVAQLPNFHRYLQNKKIDFEQITAGDYKRTLSVFAENTKAGREKFQEDINDIHLQFKQFVAQNRKQCDINAVATGEHWLGHRAFELRLVDEIKTSDDYLMQRIKTHEVYALHYHCKKRLSQRFAKAAQLTVNKLLFSWWQEEKNSRFMA